MLSTVAKAAHHLLWYFLQRDRLLINGKVEKCAVFCLSVFLFCLCVTKVT
jgi:hypothetical protein